MFDDPIEGLAQQLASPHVYYCELTRVDSERRV